MKQLIYGLNRIFSIGNSKLEQIHLQYQFSEQSFFLIYDGDLQRIIEKFGLRPHLYADDLQIY